MINSADELVEVLLQRFGLNVPEAATLWDDITRQHEKHLDEKNKSDSPCAPNAS